MAASGAGASPSSTDDLASEVAALRRRVEALERRLGDGARTAPPPLPAASPAPGQDGVPTPGESLQALASAGGIALVGRVFVALGGAFFLRALTDGAVLTPRVGTGLGLLYAAALLLLAGRAGAAGQRHRAAFDGATATLIATSLIVETTTRLAILPSTAAAGALVALVALGLGVSWYARLVFLGWTVALGVAVASLVLIIAAPSAMPFVLALFALGAAVEAMAFDDRWLGLRWPAAVALDLALFHIANMAVRPDGMPEGHAALGLGAVVAVELALPLLYISTVGVRSTVRGRVIRAFGAAQTAAALGLGLWGAARVLTAHGKPLSWVGAGALVLGALGYVVAFGNAARLADRGRNFLFYSSIALVLILVGAGLALGGAALALSWLVLALLMAIYGRQGGVVPRLHSAIYLCAAAAGGGLLSVLLDALLGKPEATWRPVDALAVAVLIGAAVAYAVLVMAARPTTGAGADGPATAAARLIAASVLGLGAVGLGLAAVGHALGAGVGAPGDAAVLAAARTAVLGVGAAIVAYAGRRFGRRELRWLVFLVLGIGAVKLLGEDLPAGRPATLFLSLAFYGLALIVTARWIRHDGPTQSRPT